MICRRCGNRIPEYLTTREYFQCPECGRPFGNPPAGDDRHGYQPRASRYDRPDEAYARRSARYEPEYDDSPADDSYYDDGQGYYDDGDGYYDDGYYDDRPYEDDGYYDDRYYDDQPYDDGYYDDGGYYDDSQDYSDDFDDFGEPAPRAKRQPQGEKRTMKLITLAYVLIAEIVILIVIACIGAGMNAGEPAKSAPTDAPAVIETTADPNATENPQPVV